MQRVMFHVIALVVGLVLNSCDRPSAEFQADDIMARERGARRIRQMSRCGSGWPQSIVGAPDRSFASLGLNLLRSS